MQTMQNTAKQNYPGNSSLATEHVNNKCIQIQSNNDPC